MFVRRFEEKTMRNFKQNIRCLFCAFLVFGFLTGLFIAPAVAKDEPKLGLKLELDETFDNPTAPEWTLSGGAEVEDGILHLPSEGAQASYGGSWHNYTSVFFIRRSGPSAIGITFTAGQDSIRLVLGDELIEARRLRSGLGVDMIVERPVPGPPEIPVGEWFTLRVTQLDTSIIVGVDGVRLYNLYDPSPNPLPSSGLALMAVGDETIEVDRVVVIPWVIENFDGPLSSAWEVSDMGTAPFVNDGKLTVPQGEAAVRKGNWGNITFYARVKRDGLKIALLTYVGHVLEIHHNFIVFSSEIGGQSHELDEAFLPELQGEPEADTWMDVMVVVRDGVHHVFAYGIELFSIPDEVLVGPVSAEAFEGDFVLDRLMLGPPLPLWPAGSGSGGGEPGGGSNGGGSDGGESDGGAPNVLSVDLAVTDLYPDHAPTGKLYFRITNNGPDTLQGAPVTVTCGGIYTNVTTGEVTHMPDTSQGTFSITLSPGQTQAFPTSINLDLNNFDYDLHCTVSAALGSGVFTDPDPGNNRYAEEFDAVIPAAPTADLAVTDLFPEQSPVGKLYLRIGNFGPDSLQSVPVMVYCGGVVIDLISGSATNIPRTLQSTFDITISPGQTQEFPTQIDLDLNAFKYGITCEVVVASDAVTDPVPSNDIYNESIELQGQARPAQTDLAVTDIFPQSLPQGEVFCRITNNGPDALQNASVQLYTHVITDTNPSGVINLASSLTVTLQLGETREFDTGMSVDTTIQGYEITCQVALPQDPNPNNDSYSEKIEILQFDLAVTDIFPDNLPNGNVYCRITNHGPDALQNASVLLTTNIVFYNVAEGYIYKAGATSISVTLQPGETGVFDTGYDVVDADHSWYSFSCFVSAMSGLDMEIANDGYSEEIGSLTPP